MNSEELLSRITPGPWVNGRKVSRFVYARDERPICECDSMGESPSSQEVANALAIAKVPELLRLTVAVSRLNPDAGEIGPGMLAELVAMARNI